LLLMLFVFRRLTGALGMALLGVVLTLVFGLEHVLIHRPQMFGEVCFALLFLPLSRPMLSRRALVLIPAVMVLWANLHGSFPMGFVVLGAFCTGRALELALGKFEIRNSKSETNPNDPSTKSQTSRRPVWPFRVSGFGFVSDFGFRISDFWSSDFWSDAALRRLTLSLLLSVAAVAVLNPHGPRLFLYSLEMSNHENIRTMDEWKPLPVSGFAGYLFLASVLMMAVLARLSPRRFTATQVLLLVGLGVQVLAHWRVMVWWGFVVVWVALPHIQALLARGRKGATPWPTVAKTGWTAGVILAGMLLSGPALWAAGYRYDLAKHVTDMTPWQVADYLREQYAADPTLKRNIFTSETMGDYLFWALRLGPPVRIFCYTHVHLLTIEHWNECMKVKFAEPSWEAILDSHCVQFLIVENTPQYHLLMEAVRAARDRWEVIIEDPLFVAKRRT
jgi:hypothetical protein